MLGWCSLAALRISRRKRSRTPRRFDQVAADDLEHFQPPHQRVLWPGRRRPCRPGRAPGGFRSRGGRPGPAASVSAGGGGRRGRGASGTIDRLAAISGRLSDWTWAFWSRPRKLSDEISATRRRQIAALQVPADRLGRGVVELAQAVGAQSLVGRVSGGGCDAHGRVPLVEVEKTAVGSSPDRDRPHLRTICRGKPKNPKKNLKFRA